MRRTIEIPALPKAPGNMSARQDVITIFDAMADTADAYSAAFGASRKGSDWSGGEDGATVTRKMRLGDLSRVGDSDKLLSKMESLITFRTTAFKIRDAVAGGAPNVPAMLAHHPLTMRVRQRVASQSAPLNVVVDIVSSGSIKAESLEKRGAALLAFARAVAAVRPVNLYVAASALPAGDIRLASSAVIWQLDTAPLDLARACHALCHPGVARLVSYDLINRQTDNGADHMLLWPYSDEKWSRAHGADYWARVVGSDEVLFIAGPHSEDGELAAMTKRPEKWLAKMLASYGGLEDE